MIEQLIKRIKNKDQKAMSQLYSQYIGLLTSVCYRYVPSEDEAKDVLQNSFIKIFTSIPSFEYRGEAAFLSVSQNNQDSQISPSSISHSALQEPVTKSHHHPTHTPSSPEKNNKWFIGVNTSGGALAMGSPVDHYSKVYMYYMMSADTYLETSGVGIYRRAPFRSECKSVLTHHLPVRFGLSLSYQLNQHLALISGLNYTYLHSEHVIPQENLVLNDQRFHYLGIPLGVSWRVWSVRRFSLYLSGRTMLEKCLNAKQWQWSVQASSGVDFSFIPQLSFYLEPSVGYYFDDGSSYKHYYKDHPLAPTFEIGMRLHLGNK